MKQSKTILALAFLTIIDTDLLPGMPEHNANAIFRSIFGSRSLRQASGGVQGRGLVGRIFGSRTLRNSTGGVHGRGLLGKMVSRRPTPYPPAYHPHPSVPMLSSIPSPSSGMMY